MPGRLLHHGWADADTRHAVWQRLSLWIVFVAVVIAVCLGSFGIYSIHQTNLVVSSHNAELVQIKQLSQAIRLDQKQHQGDLATIHQDAVSIEKYAEKLEDTQVSNHSVTLNYLEAICASTPGCPEGVQKLEGG